MTTIAMVIGMLPLALASGAGAEWKNGMAWALIGGLNKLHVADTGSGAGDVCHH